MLHSEEKKHYPHILHTPPSSQMEHFNLHKKNAPKGGYVHPVRVIFHSMVPWAHIFNRECKCKKWWNLNSLKERIKCKNKLVCISRSLYCEYKHAAHSINSNAKKWQRSGKEHREPVYFSALQFVMPQILKGKMGLAELRTLREGHVNAK